MVVVVVVVGSSGSADRVVVVRMVVVAAVVVAIERGREVAQCGDEESRILGCCLGIGND